VGPRAMFDTVILLTGPAERIALPALLSKHNPRLTVLVVETLAELEVIDARILRRARLIGFLTSVIVPARILDQLGFGAYNFHPGPPNYPGRLPLHFAIYDGATGFGATAHVMAAAVDSGLIVGVELFDIPPNIGVLALEKLAFTASARLFWRLAQALATQRQPLDALPIRWCGRKSTRRMYQTMCDFPPDISKDEFERRMRAFGDGHLGVHPTTTLHGRRFRYIPAETEAPSLVPAEAEADPVG